LTVLDWDKKTPHCRICIVVFRFRRLL